jgi:hypothetical protein
VAELEEVTIRWGDLGIGHVIPKDGRKWTVVDGAAPAQYEYGHSNWIRIQAPNGETHAIPPKPVTRRVTVLVDPEADPIAPLSHVHGSAEAALLVEQLGAVELATRDETSGEVWCPWEMDKATAILHLQVAHQIDTTGIDSAEARAEVHGRAHDIGHPLIGKKGFAHRHVPEDLSII